MIDLKKAEKVKEQISIPIDLSFTGIDWAVDTFLKEYKKDDWFTVLVLAPGEKRDYVLKITKENKFRIGRIEVNQKLERDSWHLVFIKTPTGFIGPNYNIINDYIIKDIYSPGA